MEYVIKIIEEKYNSKPIYEIHKSIKKDNGSHIHCTLNFFEWMDKYLPDVMYDKEIFDNYPISYENFYLYFKYKNDAIDFVKMLAKQDKRIFIQYEDSEII